MAEEVKITWSDEVPTKADAGDAYYFVRRKDKLDVVVMGFSMGKGWLNGVSYEPSEMRSHLFLGPITPELFGEVTRLREALEDANDLCRSAMAIAQRQGLQTNWTAFAEQLAGSLKRQHEVMYARAASCPCCAAVNCRECGPYTDETKTVIDDLCRFCGKCINHCPHQ